MCQVRRLLRPGARLRHCGGCDKLLRGQGKGVRVRQDGQFRIQAGGDETHGPRVRRRAESRGARIALLFHHLRFRFSLFSCSLAFPRV